MDVQPLNFRDFHAFKDLSLRSLFALNCFAHIPGVSEEGDPNAYLSQRQQGRKIEVAVEILEQFGRKLLQHR